MSNGTMNREINSRIVRLKLIDGALITGQVNINRAPGYERVSDIVTENTDKFLVLFGVSMNREDLDVPIRYKTLFINRNHILWAAPDEDQ